MMVPLAADCGSIWLRAPSSVLCCSSFVLTNVNQAIHQAIRDQIMSFSSELSIGVVYYHFYDWRLE